MSQTIALRARAPQVSLAKVMDDVQRARIKELAIERGERAAELDSMKTRQALDEGNALDAYRTRAKANDPQAIEELDAYPEMAKKLHDAFDGMSPEQYREASGKAQAFAQAARRVSSFTEGSPEQRQAWEIEIDKLWKGGFIDEEYRDLWKKNGPNPEIINEALDIGKWAESYTGKNAVNRARAEQIQTRAENDTRLTDARVGDIGIDNERADEKTQAQVEQGDRRVGATEQNANSLEQYRTGNLTRQQERDNALAADRQADNTRADKNVESQIKVREAKGTTTKDGKPKGGEAGSGINENEYGRRVRDIQKILEKRRADGATAEELAATERQLREKYRIPVTVPPIDAGGPGAGEPGKKDPYTDPNAKPPPMSERVIGKVYPSPTGPKEWTGTGWRKATNG